MWRHWCPVEKAWISVKRGELCNWCDTPEPEPDQEEESEQ